MCLYCIGNTSNCSIKSCGRSWSAHEGTNYAYTKALLGENCLSPNSCHFIKNIFSNQTPSCIWSICLHCSDKVSTAPSKAVVGVDQPIKALPMHIQKTYIESSHSCHFVFFFNQTLSWICLMCLYCLGKVSNCSIKSCGRSWSAHEGIIYAYTKVS